MTERKIAVTAVLCAGVMMMGGCSLGGSPAVFFAMAYSSSLPWKVSILLKVA